MVLGWWVSRTTDTDPATWLIFYGAMVWCGVACILVLHRFNQFRFDRDPSIWLGVVASLFYGAFGLAYATVLGSCVVLACLIGAGIWAYHETGPSYVFLAWIPLWFATCFISAVVSAIVIRKKQKAIDASRTDSETVDRSTGSVLTEYAGMRERARS